MALLPQVAAPPPAGSPRPEPEAPARHAPPIRPSLAAPALAAGLAALLSLWGLGHRPFWLDEGLTAGATTQLVPTLRGTGGTMALYYALLTPLGHLSMARAWLRFPSVVCAVAAIPVVWAVARRAFDRNVAGLAAAFTAASWVVVRYAQSARAYALVLLLVSISWWALLEAVQATDERRSRRAWWIFTATALIAPFAHGLAILQLGAQVTWLAAGPERDRWLRRARGPLVGSVVVTTALLTQGAYQVASWIPPIDRHQVVQVLATFTGPSLAAGLVLGGATLAGVSACLRRRRAETDPTRRWFALLPLAWGLLPVIALVVLSVARPYLMGRYVAASAPGIGMLLALTATDEAWGSRRARGGATLTIALLLLAGQVDLHRTAGDDWAGAARAIATETRPGDAVVFANPSVRSAFDYAWDELPTDARPVTPDAFSPVEPIGRLRRFYAILPPTRLGRLAAISGRPRLWVVDQEGKSATDELAEFLGDPEVRHAYAVIQRLTLPGDVRVVLLQRR